MDDKVVFKPSAFSHSVTEADILRAMDEYLYDGPM
ncbi:putative Rhs family protein, partial [Candidatus Termititenax dinenymphae]